MRENDDHPRGAFPVKVSLKKKVDRHRTPFKERLITSAAGKAVG
jgi:hypothetical protein